MVPPIHTVTPAAFPSLKHFFSRSLAEARGRLHLAAHSHHLWPDASFDGHMQAWQDAATLWDAKWTRIMGEVLPEAQRHIAHHLNIPDPACVAFAPNTHDFVRRLLSALPATRPPRILTTDGEFHSFARQIARLEEDRLLDVHRVPVFPLSSFTERFAEKVRAAPYDLVFVSHVFFESGYAIPDLHPIIEAAHSPDTLVVIDGYHAFMARPVDLSNLWQRAFYMAGGYKYAASGEGVCFLTCPPGVAPCPRDTGWYAAFAGLSGSDGKVSYAPDGARFLGATFDPSGMYRLNAVMRWMRAETIDARAAHNRARAVQDAIVPLLDRAGIPGLRATDLLVPAGSPDRGNFLAYILRQAKLGTQAWDAPASSPTAASIRSASALVSTTIRRTRRASPLESHKPAKHDALIFGR